MSDPVQDPYMRARVTRRDTSSWQSDPPQDHPTMFSPLLSKPPRSTPSCPARTRKRRPSLEALEGRQLMSLGVESLVNTTTRNAQFESDNASSANGTSVVVWT